MKELKLPIVIVNFKAYEQATGSRAVELAKICDQVSKETNKSVAICVQIGDLYRVVSEVDIPVFSEHVDSEEYGAHTGKVLINDIKENGACGSLLNHSEDRYRIDILEKAVAKLRESDLISLVCANDAHLAKSVANFSPDFIAVEPPELIGGDVSVTSANPDIVIESVNSVKSVLDIPVLCGAGIKNGIDVKKSIELGCQGVLVASGVTKSDDPKKALLDLVSGLN